MRGILLTIVGLVLAAVSAAVGYQLAIKSAATGEESPLTIAVDRSATPVEWQDESIRLQSLEEVLSSPLGFQQYLNVVALAASLDIEQLEEHLLSAFVIDPSYLSEEVCKIFLARYVELDPARALTFAHDLITPIDRNYRGLMITLYRDLALMDPDLAWENIDLLVEPARWDAIVRLLAQVVTDEARLAQYRSTLTESESRRLKRMERNRLAPQEAFRMAVDTKDPSAIQTALRNWAMLDPAEAFRNIPVGLLSDGGRTSTRVNIQSSAERVIIVSTSADQLGHRLKSAYQTVLREWAKKNPRDALSAAIALPSPEQFIKEILVEFARHDPAAALHAIDEHEWQANANYVTAVVGQWLAKDLTAATAYLDGLDAQLASQITLEVFVPLLNQDMEAAVAWMQTRPIPRGVSSLVFQLYMRDAQGTRETIEGLDSGALRSGLLQGYLLAVSSFDSPRRAMAYLEQLSSGDFKAHHASVLRQWASNDFESARQYVATLRDTTRQQQSLMTLIQAGSWRNYDASRDLLDEVDDAHRDEAVRVPVQRSGDREWSDKIELLEQIQDDELRTATLINAIMSVGRTDKKRALELLREHSLDDDEDLVNDLNRY